MPELPEVETIRRSLLPLVQGAVIDQVQVFLEKAVKPGPAEFEAGLAGRQITGIQRRGKYLLFELDSGQRLAIHLRMAGRLVWQNRATTLAKHTTLVMDFQDGKSLHFVDPRKFGTAVLFPPAAPPAGLTALGLEPLTTEKEALLAALKEAAARRSGPVKGLLLDQRILAGLGNIYADEVLFAAGVSPLRPAREVTAAEWEKIYGSIVRILNKALAYRGTSQRDYVDGRGEAGEFQHHLKVYGRKKELCLDCGAPLVYARVAGRGTHYCPTCQS
ncbi:MAG: DNA-formamidopyrimidine glycosylase [Firmicutes bacterium]|nr:DNA-formamidopyrimidine glycosylase [Bacillota bacterium]